VPTAALTLGILTSIMAAVAVLNVTPWPPQKRYARMKIDGEHESVRAEQLVDGARREGLEAVMALVSEVSVGAQRLVTPARKHHQHMLRLPLLAHDTARYHGGARTC
jgi:hypothetical protein